MNKKTIIIFVGSFLVTAMVGITLLMGLMSQTSQSVSNSFFGNFFLSITALFWILVGIPSIVAYFLTFHYLQVGNLLPSRKKAVWGVGLVLFCLILITAAGKFFLKVRWAPYSLQSVTEEELAQPSEKNNGVVIEKEAGEITYQLRRDGYKSETLRLYRYNKVEDLVETMDVPRLFRSVGGNGVTDFWYEGKGNDLWTIERNANSSYLFLYQNSSGNREVKGGSVKKKLLTNVASGVYAGSAILGFIDSTKELLLSTGMGDGCGGGGTVWAVTTAGVRRDIQQYESGCANTGKLPDMIGAYKSVLIFASYKKDGNDLELTKLYFYNPDNGAEETLITSKELPEDINYAHFTGENKNVVVLSTAFGPENKSYNFDLTSRKIVQYGSN